GSPPRQCGSPSAAGRPTRTWPLRSTRSATSWSGSSRRPEESSHGLTSFRLLGLPEAPGTLLPGGPALRRIDVLVPRRLLHGPQLGEVLGADQHLPKGRSGEEPRGLPLQPCHPPGRSGLELFAAL